MKDVQRIIREITKKGDAVDEIVTSRVPELSHRKQRNEKESKTFCFDSFAFGYVLASASFLLPSCSSQIL